MSIEDFRVFGAVFFFHGSGGVVRASRMQSLQGFRGTICFFVRPECLPWSVIAM